MIKKIAIFAVVIIVVIILAVILWPRTKTVTVTAAPSTTTLTVTKTLAQTVTTTTINSSSQFQPVTTTVTVTTTAAPTFAPCAYQCSLIGTWSGKITTNGAPMSGTLALTIDANGAVKGTFDGSFTGTITGNVDLVGNIAAVGATTSGTLHIASSWSAQLVVTGNTMSGQGTWNAGDAGGTCSGTGTITK